MFMREDEPFKVARVEVGRAAGQAVSTYAFPASEIGTPTVGFGNNLDDFLHHMKPETAHQIAVALLTAAYVAEGAVLEPALAAAKSTDKFVRRMESRQAAASDLYSACQAVRDWIARATETEIAADLKDDPDHSRHTLWRELERIDAQLCAALAKAEGKL